jgi:23S rRNA (cytidine2498-2'-O)-methyltransferase
MRASHSDDSDAGHETPSMPLLVRLPEVFAGMIPEILGSIDGGKPKRYGKEYFRIQGDPVRLRASEAGKFVSWYLPVEHGWPCRPENIEGFVEKAAQALVKKFAQRHPQAILIGQLDPSASNRYYKTLASNLRGRVLQVFPAPAAGWKGVEEQDAERATLFCLVGKEGLFCGLVSPREANGFYPGGTKYIRQTGAETISRAGAKIAEALHFLRLYQPELPAGSRWLELGASPGGMTSELLQRGYTVTAVDRAVLDARLNGAKGLRFTRADVSTFVPPKGAEYDALLSDMNGDPQAAMRQVGRLSAFLRPGGLAVFTLKTTSVDTFEGINALEQDVIAQAARDGLSLLAKTHLTYNRQEFTLFFQKN